MVHRKDVLLGRRFLFFALVVLSLWSQFRTHRSMNIFEMSYADEGLPRKHDAPHIRYNNNMIQDTKLPTESHSSTQKTQNKTLVLLTGNLRGGEATWRSLYRHVLDVNMADLALVIGKTSPNYVNSSILKRAKYIWTVPEYDDWADAMELIPNKAPDWRDHLFPKEKKQRKFGILLGGAQQVKGSGALVFMYRFFATQKMKQYNLTQTYDRFILSRTDHYYACPHNVSTLNRELIWVPFGEAYGGICDRHLVANSKDIIRAMHVLPPLLQSPAKYVDVLESENITNTETFLKFRWKEQGLWRRVKRFKRPMFVATVEGDPKSRWARGQFQSREFDNVGVKYNKEFRQIRKTCKVYLQSQRERAKLRPDWIAGDGNHDGTKYKNKDEETEELDDASEPNNDNGEENLDES